MTVARLIDVSVQRSARNADRELTNVSMSFPEGKFSAILGPNGSSKSLLMEVLGGLASVDSGQVFTCGVELTALAPQNRTRLLSESVAFVFNEHNVIRSLTFDDNLLLAHKFSRRPVDRELYRDVVESFGLAPYLGMKPSPETTDINQRLAIARAVLKKAKLVLACEPTQFLQHKPSENVLDSLRRCSREYGMSIILSTHSNFVATYADEVHVFLDGAPTGSVVNPSLPSLAFAQENITYSAR
ncbi:ABC transporter ATP-binding protein [Arcanobacterium pinnipediorum]|uniref:ATP-binding cassette domain-containing protein n=1 Tax=Arcanobacterium pinnipediorum TaxID=1503041 RepID=A0ABY5AIF8_9ACTO|nr:ATP-binding cassette domain-containing protein [Arcanobacterium pinnipediorum]USR79780.1 ATP-binding cassette domain-containing protein [Arcanobacterium pinnipediorum]